MAQFLWVLVEVVVIIQMQEALEVIPHLKIQLGRQPTLPEVVEEEDLEIAIFPIKTQVFQFQGLMVDLVEEEDKEMVMHLLH
tara:strand:+ start:471 stop:716 length:246 start_codon:yes stop_codon:yes gene_type:complete